MTQLNVPPIVEAEYIGDMSLGGTAPVFYLKLAEPVELQDGNMAQMAFAYVNGREDDFEYGQRFTVRYREGVRQKTHKADHCIVDIIGVLPPQKQDSVSLRSLENQAAIPEKRTVKVNLASKERKKVCMSGPVSLFVAFDELAEEIAGDYAESNKRWITLQRLMEHYLSSPF